MITTIAARSHTFNEVSSENSGTLIKGQKFPNKCVVNADACKKCGACMKIGCPAISVKKDTKKARIDDTLCVGCELCVKMCKFDAIKIND